MNEEQVKAVFLLAGIEVLGLTKIRNDYWPAHPDYDKDREESPWWIVKTEFGDIKIGWRKRVISIDWSGTPYRMDSKSIYEYEFHKRPISNKDVTMWETGIHSWGYPEAIGDLMVLKLRQRQWQYATSVEGMRDLANRKEKYLAEQAKAAK